MKTLFAIALTVFLAGCGGYEERTTGMEEETTLIIRGETLVGMTVSLDSGFRRVISEDDLTEYDMSILGSANSEVEDLESITLMVESGQQRVTISKGGSTLVDRQLHFTHGQTRELRIR